MGLTELVFGGKTRANVGVVQFDASVSEIYTDTVEITDHPVETGSVISDHIRKLPSSIEINGVVTNNPLVFLASSRAESPLITDTSRPDDRVEAAYTELRRVQNVGEVVDVVTSLRDYSNMVIESISVSRDANTGNILNSSITLREITIAKEISIETPVPITEKVSKKKKTNKGNKSKTAATTQQEQKVSALKSIVQSITG
jgi:hypothetical protein